jgi:hypothetical protein
MLLANSLDYESLIPQLTFFESFSCVRTPQPLYHLHGSLPRVRVPAATRASLRLTLEVQTANFSQNG